MRGKSCTPSPQREYGRRGRSPGPRGRHDRGDVPKSLLVRNLRCECRPEDLRRPFGQFGHLKDIYLPRHYYTGEPRGFGFVQYVDPADTAEAKYEMDGQLFQGRELTVVFAEDKRKKPTEMRYRERGRGRVYDRRRSPPRYSHSPRYSPYPPSHHGGSQSRRGHHSPKRKHSRSISPREKRGGGERPSYSKSPVQEHSPLNDGPRNNHNGSQVRRHSPSGSRSHSQSAGKGHSPVKVPSPSRSRSRSPYPSEYAREPGSDKP